MILVTGATGNVGRPLIDLLAISGAGIRAVTRNPQAAALPAGVELVEGDPSRPDTIAPLLQGVTSVFLNPRAVGQAADDLLTLARKREVRRIMTLSATNVDDDPALQPSRAGGVFNKEVEDAVTGSGLEWVSLRSTLFATNSIGLWSAQIRAGDIVRGPYAKAMGAPIHERDLAALGARALLTDDLVGRRLQLTGPQSLDQEEMVTTIGDAIGRPLRYEEIPPEVSRRGMVNRGFSQPFADAYLSMQASAVGKPAFTTSEVEQILGRRALTYAQWATDHAEAFQN
ncbi:NAD(P)H-binding protein [Streptantibioticus ferralitis]|uniref:NAD(P)H-binding protein n=1 Tax=Streptantibioticus ferralitis TaxID=236510 RepID=A0ABT5ZA08_9ACTN|nr:NAD(P)H-binding protein [Streptantibioticus ferralitis]MDF2260462.1 NAD(P)H-binding protein [Streptantibioticus ferralitis]